MRAYAPRNRKTRREGRKLTAYVTEDIGRAIDEQAKQHQISRSYELELIIKRGLSTEVCTPTERQFIDSLRKVVLS